MRNKKIIIFSLTVIVLLVAVAVFFVRNNKPTKNNDFLNNVQYSSQCAKEGETTGTAGMPSLCCSGLKSVGGWPGGYSGDCTLPPPTGLNICAKCGDSKCDTDNGENKCNCKEDCTGAETPCVGYLQNISDVSKQSCCGKFKAIKIALYLDDCSITPNSAPVSIKCMNCGDGRCNQGVYLENKCNCPEDCASSVCGNEGDTLGGKIDRCCSGLKPKALSEFGGLFECAK